MWRRIIDYQKQREAFDIQTNRLLHYFQTQNLEAIDAYSRIAISNEKNNIFYNTIYIYYI